MLKQGEYFLFLEPLDPLELRGDELPPLSAEETLMLHEPSFLVFSEHWRSLRLGVKAIAAEPALPRRRLNLLCAVWAHLRRGTRRLRVLVSPRSVRWIENRRGVIRAQRLEVNAVLVGYFAGLANQ